MRDRADRKFKRTCAACGEVGAMNKEHFWPMWLIQKTASKGVLFAPGKRVNPRSLTVPLCMKCNTDFGRELETPVSKILPGLEAGDGLSDREAEILVRWLWKFEGLSWIFSHPHGQYTQQYTLRERVLGPIDAIRDRLTLAVSIVAVVNPEYGEEPMGLSSRINQSAIHVAAVFGRVAMMVLLDRFESDVPPAFSMYRFSAPDSPDRDAKLFHPNVGFATCVEAVNTTRHAALWLSYYHDRAMDEELAKPSGVNA
jgi:hypothetical protein